MKRSRYHKSKQDILFFTLLVSVVPLIFLGALLYYQVSEVPENRIESHTRSLAISRRSAVEVFLRERTAILTTIADTHRFDQLNTIRNLSDIFEVINRRADGMGLVDLGVIDDAGNQTVYIGPYELRGYNYFQHPWFAEVMARGRYISDVYMGYRQQPHFIIAVRGYDDGRSWVLRATIDSDVFNRLVRTGRFGKRGDAFIINKAGYFQTDPRFHGAVLEKCDIDPDQFPEDAGAIEIKAAGITRYYAGSWLKNGEWLLVISQEAQEEVAGLRASLNKETLIILLACMAIITATFITTHMAIRRLEAAGKELDRLNAQLIQSDKMAALGKMAAGIAHEINNPLAVIGEKAGWMRDLLSEENFHESEHFREYMRSVEKIEAHVERASKIIHNMLGFARRMEPRRDDVDVNAIIIQTIELLRNHARINNIEIRTDLQSDLPVIAGDPSQLQQVLLNLINNAVDAIGKDGSIDIQTLTSDPTLEIHVTDSGPGIPEDQQPRIFDPFYTTKAPSKGTGLGLSISYGIIQDMGGTITFSSRTDRGTEFVVKLPLKIPSGK